DDLEILALGDEQNRGARRDHTGGPGKLGEERHFTEECAASEARDDDGLSVGIGGAPRDFELTASDDVRGRLLLTLADHGVARGDGQGLEGRQQIVECLFAEGAEEGQRRDSRWTLV